MLDTISQMGMKTHCWTRCQGKHVNSVNHHALTVMAAKISVLHVTTVIQLWMAFAINANPHAKLVPIQPLHAHCATEPTMLNFSITMNAT